MTEKDVPIVLQLARGANDNSDPDPVPLDLGSRVRDLRKSRGWTLEQAAKQAGLARSTLSKIENGQMSPTYDALKKLASGLSISVPQLFTPPQKEQVMGRMRTELDQNSERKFKATIPTSRLDGLVVVFFLSPLVVSWLSRPVA